MSDENGSNITPLLGDAEPRAPTTRPRVQAAAAARDRSCRSALLALVSTIFGMMMAVASRPAGPREPRASTRTRATRSSSTTTASTLGVLTNNQSRVLVRSGDISPLHAQRDHLDRGQALLRELAASTCAASPARSSQDVVHSGKPSQGGSTIAQQFVKNALRAQCNRTVFEKLREAALAYHLTRKWSKEKILTEYLNSIYFGNGAYGIESAARTYFGNEPDHLGCGGRRAALCAKELQPAGGGAARRRSSPTRAPSTRSPTPRPRTRAAQHRARARCSSRATSRRREYHDARRTRRCPRRPTSSRRTVADARRRYFTSWVRQQLVDRYGAASRVRGRPEDQDDARPRPPAGRREGDRRSASPTRRAVAPSLVAIDNATGEVRAMVGGRDYRNAPVQPRHAGPAPARLVVQAVRPRDGARGGHLPRTRCGRREARLHRAGTRAARSSSSTTTRAPTRARSTLAGATAFSDNAVFAAVGIKVGTEEGRRAGPADGHPHAGLRRTTR